MKIIDFKHLEDNNFTYLYHFKRAMSISFLMWFGSLFCFIHAIFPFLFPDVASNTLKKIQESHNLVDKDK